MKKYMCDFETSTEAWLERDNGVARVWAACICTIEEEPKVISLTNNIDDFMIALEGLGNVECYFHNLKYDGEYILSWLFKNNFVYDERGKKERSFNCIISDVGQWYSIEITYKKYNKRLKRVRIYDSLKKLPLKVSRIAKTFNLPISKLEIDYDEYRPVGYELTDHEKEYVTNDCLIVAKALFIQFSKDLKKMTIGSDALTNFKATVGGKKGFKYLFPTLPIEVDNDFRLAYRGGFTMVNPKYRNKNLSGISFDVNSLYPSVMYGKMGKLPYGYPVRFQGKYKPNKEYPLYIQKLSCKFVLKKDHIPTMQMKGNLLFCPTEYVTNSNGIVDLVLTNVDLELLFEHYNVYNIEYACGYMFKGVETLFREYIDYWMSIKAASKGGMRQLAKLMLNSLYGKFATNPKRINKIPIDTDEGIKLQVTDPEYNDPVYTAMGCFVTAYARRWTISNSQALYPYWVYSDTDSMYLTGITEEEASKYIKIHPTNLGEWKLEHHFTRGKWLRAKTYIINSTEDGLSIACAGMPDNIKEDILSKGEDKAFRRFRYGEKFEGKLIPKRVEGGVVLCKTEFTIARLN